ncbi:hypothetical protein BTH42_22435 [Burkholderia sp. SRS-W-2-2016]|uniref:hypothetical protein n=1 Tax=Burkholderia sp. SRS-W-2-2016 TaxID=1926878 RepID=UPI00094B5279|nr:hypothetical protein [Burkholderia sp. SRS-W-2-2016]OLL29491.1 hypothetical protein BTH42_22435 [Burkholderia sp. SRS-W-2-2016]
MKSGNTIPNHLTDEDTRWWSEFVNELTLPKVHGLLDEALRAQREAMKRWDHVEAKAKRQE